VQVPGRTGRRAGGSGRRGARSGGTAGGRPGGGGVPRSRPSMPASGPGVQARPPRGSRLPRCVLYPDPCRPGPARTASPPRPKETPCPPTSPPSSSTTSTPSSGHRVRRGAAGGLGVHADRRAVQGHPGELPGGGFGGDMDAPGRPSRSPPLRWRPLSRSSRSSPRSTPVSPRTSPAADPPIPGAGPPSPWPSPHPPHRLSRGGTDARFTAPRGAIPAPPAPPAPKSLEARLPGVARLKAADGFG
jgi:hypothetical protein